MWHGITRLIAQPGSAHSLVNIEIVEGSISKGTEAGNINDYNKHCGSLQNFVVDSQACNLIIPACFTR